MKAMLFGALAAVVIFFVMLGMSTARQPQAFAEPTGECPPANMGHCEPEDLVDQAITPEMAAADALAAGGGAPPSTPIFDYLTAIGLAQDNMRAALKDPGSAQYRDVWQVNVTSDAGTLFAFCGEVNSRNGLGGYVGFRRFVATPVVAASSEQEGFDKLYKEVCIDFPRVRQVAF